MARGGMTLGNLYFRTVGRCVLVRRIPTYNSVVYDCTVVHRRSRSSHLSDCVCSVRIDPVNRKGNITSECLTVVEYNKNHEEA